MNSIDVKVYAGHNVNGSGCAGCCAGCAATSDNIELEYGRMVESLQKTCQEAGQAITFSFIDTTDKDLAAFPEIEKVIMHGYSFPVTVINDTPYLAGAIDRQAVAEIINDISRGVEDI